MTYKQQVGVTPLYCSCILVAPLATSTTYIPVKVPKYGHQLWDCLLDHGTMTQLEFFSCLEERCLETKGARGKNTSVGKTNLLPHPHYGVPKNLAGVQLKLN